MKLTIIQTGDVPAPLRPQFGPYPPMFHRMFEQAGQPFSFDNIPVFEGAAFPDPAELDGIVITGSAAGVYDDFYWLNPLRDFIRKAYAVKTPMLGVCFGHQIMADALGGDVRKSEKGWGLGRHVYATKGSLTGVSGIGEELAVSCSHQDQVIAPPPEAEVILASEFTPNAGLRYRNGAALSFQPHPEFDDAYTVALAELRRGKVPDHVVETAVASVARAPDHDSVAGFIGAFMAGAGR